MDTTGTGAENDSLLTRAWARQFTVMSDIPTSPSEITYENISTLKYFQRIFLNEALRRWVHRCNECLLRLQHFID